MRDTIELLGLLDNANVKAFLAVIRAGEGTADEGGYRRHFGNGTFDSFADHPRKAITAGLGKNKYTSTAAGAYQILARTWDGLVKRYDFDDFEPATQDVAAIALIDGRKALDDVIAGRFETAVAKCAREWASLPGSPYGQPVKTMEQASATYIANGGSFDTSAERVQISDESKQEAHMAPFVAAGIAALIQSAPALIRVFGDSPQAEKNAKAAEMVAEIAKAATGESTVEGAVNAIQSDPEKAAAYREQIHLSMNDLVSLAERVNAMDQKNTAAARDYNATDPLFIDWPCVKMKFIHVLSILFVSFSGAFVWAKWDALTPELKGAVITLMVIAGWNGVRDYWMGSSSGSERKTAMLADKP
jgi:muramidase (phage lysozyme)